MTPAVLEESTRVSGLAVQRQNGRNAHGAALGLWMVSGKSVHTARQR